MHRSSPRRSGAGWREPARGHVAVIAAARGAVRAARGHLVGRVAVPHDQLAVLRGGHQVAGVCAPVHCVDLCKVEIALFQAGLTGEWGYVWLTFDK